MADAIELKRRGNQAVAERRYSDAESAFRELLKLEPANPDGYVGLARVYDRTNRHSQTVQLLEPVVAELGTFASLCALADAYRVLAYRGDRRAVDSAIRCYEKLRTLRSDPVSLYNLGQLYREKKRDFSRGLAALSDSWQAAPGSDTVYRAAAHCAKELGDPASQALVDRMRSHLQEDPR